jgi:ribosomal subunit interface protein
LVGYRRSVVDVVVSSRHCEVSDRFREHVEEKLLRLEKHDHRIIRVDVLLEKEARPRDPERSVRVELTAKSRGPIVRAEASAEDKMAALDLALDKMAAQMRRAADRRKVHRGQHGMESLGQAMARSQANGATGSVVAEGTGDQEGTGPLSVTGDGPLVVREKAHAAAPMTLDQALYEMELVGHDFYLFVDKESEKPSVVYRRRGYDYGVISLELDD